MKCFVWYWKMVSLSVRSLFYHSTGENPLYGEKHRSIVQLATQYLFPMSWKITFKQSLFLMWDCLCLFDTPMKFLCSFLCLLFCLFFSCVTVARSNENHSIMQADNWMICWVRAKCMIRLPGKAKISGDEWDLWPQQKNKARLIVSLT